MAIVFETTGELATGTVVVPVEGPQDRWTVQGSCGCLSCQREAFGGAPMRLVMVRDSDRLLATCVAQSRVTVASEES
jgi:hypothetical protein